MTDHQHRSLVYALGDSHVRTFSYHDGFLPLYVGPGFANCFLTPELAAVAEDKVFMNLARLPKDCAVLLAFGEPDVRFHHEDRFGTQRDGDHKALRTAVARYAATLGRVCDRTKVRLAVMNVPPSVDEARSALALLYNSYLAEQCPALGVSFIDIWSDLVDSRTGRLQSKFDADGIHLTPAILPALSSALHEKNMVSDGFPGAPNFAWSFNYRIALTAAVETRFWGNKSNAACADRLVDYVVRSRPDATAGTAAVLNCREGYIALALASHGFSRVCATDAQPAKRRLAREVARFAQRPQVQIMEPRAFEDDAGQAPLSTLIDYSPGRTADVSPQYLEQISSFGNRLVVVASRDVLTRYPRLASEWLIDETTFGKDADDIIMDSRRT